MIRKLYPHALLAAVLAPLLVACSESGRTDPYKTVTLREVTRGMAVSKGFKYKLVNPEIVELNRHFGLIREGNQLEFIVARSLEDKLEGHMDGYLELSVVKRFSPFVHFRVERIATETDTIYPAQAGSIAYPRITDETSYGTESFVEHDLDAIPWNNTMVLNKLVDKKIKVSGKLATQTIEGRTQYFLEGKNGKLRIGDTGDALGLILKVLAKNNYLFEGGIKMIEKEPFADRRRNKVAGTVEVLYVMYGDRLITG